MEEEQKQKNNKALIEQLSFSHVSLHEAHELRSHGLPVQVHVAARAAYFGFSMNVTRAPDSDVDSILSTPIGRDRNARSSDQLSRCRNPALARLEAPR